MSSDNRDTGPRSARHYPARPKAVYLLGTCLVDSFYPQAGMDAISLLEREGIEVIFPQQQTCCGQPAYNSGYDEQARQVARQQLAAFAADIPVVVMMGSCAAMLHHDYPRLFAGEPEEAQAKALAARSYEFSEFMVNVLQLELTDNSPQPLTVALHTSCSARRSMRVAEQHKALLSSLSGVQLVEPLRATECCGFGGTFAVKQGDISAAMAKDKADNMAATEADMIVSGDCGCLMNIAGTLEKQGRAIPAKHLATLLWERSQ